MTASAACASGFIFPPYTPPPTPGQFLPRDLHLSGHCSGSAAGRVNAGNLQNWARGVVSRFSLRDGFRTVFCGPVTLGR